MSDLKINLIKTDICLRHCSQSDTVQTNKFPVWRKPQIFQSETPSTEEWVHVGQSGLNVGNWQFSNTLSDKRTKDSVSVILRPTIKLDTKAVYINLLPQTLFLWSCISFLIFIVAAVQKIVPRRSSVCSFSCIKLIVILLTYFNRIRWAVKIAELTHNTFSSRQHFLAVVRMQFTFFPQDKIQVFKKKHCYRHLVSWPKWHLWQRRWTITLNGSMSTTRCRWHCHHMMLMASVHVMWNWPPSWTQLPSHRTQQRTEFQLMMVNACFMILCGCHFQLISNVPFSRLGLMTHIQRKCVHCNAVILSNKDIYLCCADTGDLCL